MPGWVFTYPWYLQEAKGRLIDLGDEIAGGRED